MDPDTDTIQIRDALSYFFLVFCVLKAGIRIQKKPDPEETSTIRSTTKSKKLHPIMILPGVVLQKARGVCVGPRHLQERLGGDV